MTHGREAGKIGRYKDGQGEEGIRIGGSANAYIYIWLYMCTYIYKIQDELLTDTI